MGFVTLKVQFVFVQGYFSNINLYRLMEFILRCIYKEILNADIHNIIFSIFLCISNSSGLQCWA